MATLTVQQVDIDGLGPTFAAASAGGDTVRPGPTRFLVVKNGGGGSINVTLEIEGNLESGAAYPDQVIAVPAGAERWMLLTHLYDDATDHSADITYSGVTTVTVGVFDV